jgi:MFS family permease
LDELWFAGAASGWIGASFLGASFLGASFLGAWQDRGGRKEELFGGVGTEVEVE